MVKSLPANSGDGFYLCCGKIPLTEGQLSLKAEQLLNPKHPRACALQQRSHRTRQGEAMHQNQRVQLEKACPN